MSDSDSGLVSTSGPPVDHNEIQTKMDTLRDEIRREIKKELKMKEGLENLRRALGTGGLIYVTNISGIYSHQLKDQFFAIFGTNVYEISQ